MFKGIEKLSFQVILLVFGLVLLMFSIYDVQSFKSLNMDAREEIIWPSMIVGACCSALAVVFHLL